MNSIVAHTLVKNEALWLWYAVSSVVNHVDKLLLWDTGSTDGTLEIIEELRKKYPDKIEFRQYGEVTSETFTRARQEMLDATISDWFIVVDADEVWWEESIKKITDLIREKGNELESIVVPTINPVGDVFHRQEEKAGRYKLAGRTGHYNLRAVNRKILGLHSEGAHGVWGWVDGDNRMIQDRGSKVGFVDAPYLHTTFLPRAGEGKDAEVIKRGKKLKHEIGEPFPKDFYYPEVFFRSRPEFIKSPWRTMDFKLKFRSSLETPLRKLKRRIWWGRAGY